MSFPIRSVAAEEFPPLLREIPQPPEQLTIRGALPRAELQLLAVVGSRNYTSYGKQVVAELISQLQNYPVGIISGLALGIDSLAHQAALDNNLYTLAVPGGGLNDSVLYPAKHKRLAQQILEAGGGLLSEYDSLQPAAPWTFPQRNRIVCGMSHATLLIEAGEKSGTLITARLATDYNRDVLVVPGSIFSANSAGTHQFLKLGATPVTSGEDILYALGIDPTVSTQPLLQNTHNLTTIEQNILSLLSEPLERDTLIRRSGLAAPEANIILMQLEMNDLIKESDGTYRRV